MEKWTDSKLGKEYIKVMYLHPAYLTYMQSESENCSVESDSLWPNGLYTLHEILQARILEWVAFPFSRGSSQPRYWTQVSLIAGRFFTSWATREALYTLNLYSAVHELMDFPGGPSGKEPACKCRRRKRCQRHRFDPWVRKIPWRRAWQLTPVFLPGKSHGQRSLGGYSPWGLKESDITEVT